jgi:PKD repeat protein
VVSTVRSGQAVPAHVTPAVFEKAVAYAKAHGLIQHQGQRRVNGAMIASGPATSGYALPPGAPPVGCSTLGNVGGYTWPTVNHEGTPCYLDGYGSNSGTGSEYVPAYGPQTVFPGQSFTLGTVINPLSNPNLPAGPVPSAWQLGWDNLFDYWPLLRSTTGLAANEISGYDFVWENGIAPQLDNSGCYTASGGYDAGRFQNVCTVADDAGPYYATPAGQEVPWMVAAGSIDDRGGGSGGAPAVFNCFEICPGPPQWDGVEIEEPVNIEPSPYAGFEWIGSGLYSADFSDTSLSDLQITSWSWNFGDGSTSSEQDPDHVYSTGGQYTVSLTITSVDGQTSTTSGTVTVPGYLTVSSQIGKSSSTQTLPMGQSLPLSVTVTNPDEQGVLDVTPATPVLPADGALTWSGSWDCSNCQTPLPPGDSETFTSEVTAAAVNTHSDTVSVSVSGTEDTVAVSGGPATSNAVRTLEDVTVTALVPGTGQDDGGDPITVVGTGFQSANKTSLVKSVTFDPTGGSTPLAGVNVVVSSDTSLTVTTPSAATLAEANPTGPVTADVVVHTATQTSPESQADLFTFQCSKQTALDVGDYVAAGCFNAPDKTDDTLASPGQLDGMQVTPASSATVVDFSTLASSPSVGVSGGSATLGVNLGNFGIASLCLLPSSATLAAGSTWTCTVSPGATVAGWPVFGSVSFNPTGAGTVSGTLTTQLPPILGGGTATMTFTSSASSGTTVTVTAPNGGNLGQLWGLTFKSLSFNSSKGTWDVTGSAQTSAGKDTNFTGQLTYSGTSLIGGRLTVGEISVGGILTFSKIDLGYASGSWTASATLAQAKQTAAVSLKFNSTGQLTSGSITTGKILLFDCLPLDSLSLTYSAGAWGLATTASVSGGGTLGASLAIANGEVTGGSITLSGGSLPLFNQLSLTALALSYSSAAGKTTYAATIGVQLPGTVVSGVVGSFTVTNGTFTDGSLKVTGNVPLFAGLVLHSLEASFKTPTNPDGTSGLEVCGGVGLTAGPTVGDTSIAEIDGALDYTFPSSTGSSVYRAVGSLVVPSLGTDNGVLGTAAMKYVSDSSLATFQLSLGKGGASAHCPLAALGTSTGLKLPGGLQITGTINGDLNSTELFVTGSASIVAPKIAGMAGGVDGTVAIDATDITACASVAGIKGRSGFTYTWDGAYTPYVGDCVLPSSPFA